MQEVLVQKDLQQEDRMLSRELLNLKLKERSIMLMIWDTIMVESQDQEEETLEEMQWVQLVISILHKFTISLTTIIQILPELLQRMQLNSSISWDQTEQILKEQDQLIQCTTIRTTATERIEPTGFICLLEWELSATPPPNGVLNKTEQEGLLD